MAVRPLVEGTIFMSIEGRSDTNKSAAPLLGIGLYSVNDVSVLLGIPTTTVHRWIEGYSFPLSRWSKSHKPPVFIASLPRSDGKIGLTFLDLVQLRVVQGFRKAGVPLQRIRAAAVTAADVFGTSHPFAFERFRTDGRDVFAKVVVDAAEVGLLNLSSSGQRAFPEWVEQSLRELSFATETRLAERWYIAGPGGGIVVDPRIAFGRPVVENAGVPTRVIWEQAQSDGEPRSLAEWFRLEVRQVQDALRFEGSATARAA